MLLWLLRLFDDSLFRCPVCKRIRRGPAVLYNVRISPSTIRTKLCCEPCYDEVTSEDIT